MTTTDAVTGPRQSLGDRWTNWVLLSLTITLVLFHLFTAYFGAIDAYLQRTFHLALVMLYGFVLSASKQPRWRRGIDFAWALAIIASVVYVFVDYDQFIMRRGDPALLDLVVGAVILVAVLVLTKRHVGWPMVIVALVFLSQAVFGNYFPGPFRAPSLSIGRVIEILFMETYGLYSTPLAVMATYLFLFLFFSAILEKSGAIDFFMDLAFGLVGHRRGGPAQVAVVSSAAMGTVSGSPIANVITTGTFTIPLMKKYGFTPIFAGAIEAVASSGGQIMPPVMGVTAFLIAEFMNVSYWTVVKAAIIPAILYFAAVFIAIDFQAARSGLKGLPRNQLPKVGPVLRKRGYLLLPLLTMFVLLNQGYSPGRVGFIAIASLFVILMLQRDRRFTPFDLLAACRSAVASTLSVTTAVAAAGIITGTVFVSGLGTLLSNEIVRLSAGQVLPALLLTAIVGIILGMGMPTPAVYVTLAITVVPALTKLGIDKMGAHMFVFFFGVISGLTPPVALAAYAAAGISGADPQKTGWTAFRLSAVTLLLPFMWIYAPVLLGKGDLIWILQSVASAMIGVSAIAAGTQGWLIVPLNWVYRLQCFAAGVLTIVPEVMTDVAGLVWFALLIFLGYRQRRLTGGGSQVAQEVQG